MNLQHTIKAIVRKGESCYVAEGMEIPVQDVAPIQEIVCWPFCIAPPFLRMP